MKEILVLLAALLDLHPFPAVEARCVERHRLEIASRVWRVEQELGVPGGLLLAVGFYESHDGCDPRSGGNWGALRRRPRAAPPPRVPGTVEDAGRALAAGYAVCGTWEGAASRFRCGLCVCPPDHDRPLRAGELTCPAPGVRVDTPTGAICHFVYMHNQGYTGPHALGDARKLYGMGGDFTPLPEALRPRPVDAARPVRYPPGSR